MIKQSVNFYSISISKPILLLKWRFNVVKISVFLLLVFNTSCKKEDIDISNLNNNQISIIGHGGMGSESIYPLNSLASINKSIDLGVDGIELDIQFTKDSVLVVYHDRDLKESTNKSGSIFNKNWNEISGAHYSKSVFNNQQLLTLNRVKV